MSVEDFGDDVQKEYNWSNVVKSEGISRARALRELSQMHWENSNYKEALAHAQAARDLFLEEEPGSCVDELMDINIGVMNNLDMLNRSAEAAEAAAEVIALYRETDHPMLGELLRDEAAFRFTSGEYEKSIALLTECMAIPDVDISENQRGFDFLNLGMTLKKVQKYQEALIEVRYGLEVFTKLRDVYWVSKCHSELAEIYFKIGDSDEIEKWSRKALDFAEIIGDGRSQYILNYFLGVSQRIRGDIDLASSYLGKAKAQVLVYQPDWNYVVDIEKELAGLEIVRGNEEHATELFRRIATIEETLLAS